MKSLDSFSKIFLYKPHVDFRKQIDGLAAIVEGEMRLSPFQNQIFAFTNVARSRLKILYWDRTGFALWQKRLEKNRFPWPERSSGYLELTAKQIGWILDGVDIFKIRPHEELNYTKMFCERHAPC